jgi:anti-sigma-K factor RskA
MARQKETQVNKSNSFEEWRQSTNETSLDLGAVAGKANYTYSELSSGNPIVIDNLDAETRIADSYKTVTGLENQQYVRDTSSTGLKLDYIADTFVDNRIYYS